MDQYQKKLLSQKQGKFNLADFTNFLTTDKDSGSSSVMRNQMLITDDHLEKLDLSKMTEMDLFKYNLNNENAEKKKARGEQMHREFMLKKKWEKENKLFMNQQRIQLAIFLVQQVEMLLIILSLEIQLNWAMAFLQFIRVGIYLHLIGIIFNIIVIKKD